MRRWSEDEAAEFCHHDAWETGQEDLPSAYRYCPMSAGELRLRCRLVSLMSGKLRYPRSMQASCLGSPWQSLRSTDFPRLLEALTRWYCQVLTSLYFNAAITDVRSAKGSGQWAMKQLCLMIGSLFAEDKTQTMQSTGASLGLTHDLSCINKTGHLRF